MNNFKKIIMDMPKPDTLCKICSGTGIYGAKPNTDEVDSCPVIFDAHSWPIRTCDCVMKKLAYSNIINKLEKELEEKD